MVVLFLGNIGSPVIEILKSKGEDVVLTTQPLNTAYINEVHPDFIVSYGYPHIVPPEVIELVDGKIINLHISYLPWNKGADPDFWSLVDNTPKGVTIHYMDENLDTGDIIVQSEVTVEDKDTLASYFTKLQEAIAQLFEEHWDAIRSGTCSRSPQGDGGSYHRAVDKGKFADVLVLGANTPVADLSNFKS